MINLFKQTELYVFSNGSNIIRYTSGMKPVEINGLIFTRESIKRTAIKRDSTLSKNKVEISVPISNKLAQDWINPDITKYLLVDIFVNNDNSLELSWSGRLTKTKISKKEMTFTFELFITRSGNTAVNERVQRTCRYQLYGKKCGLNKKYFAISGEITGMEKNTLIVNFESSIPDNYLASGIVDFEGIEQTYIIANTDKSITMIRENKHIKNALKYGSVKATFYKGCDRTTNACKSFKIYDEKGSLILNGNLINYGGFPYLPLESPTKTSIG